MKRYLKNQKKKINLLLIQILLLPNIVWCEPYKIIKVIDGDTIKFEANFLPDPLPKTLLLRIYGADTPEKDFRSHCDLENKLGQNATKFTEELVLNSKTHDIQIKEWDKFGGRVLGDLILDGKSLRELLISKGYARPYFGEKKQSWCY